MDDNIFVKFGCIIAVIFFFGYIISQNAATIESYLLVGGIVIAVILFVIFGADKLFTDRRVAKLSEGMPIEGPMKVKVSIEQIHARKHRLHIDVKMTKRDFEAIKQTGMASYALFYKDGVTSLDNHYCPLHLASVKYVDFDDLAQAEDAKEKLIQGLQAMRSRIEQQHTFNARPAERKESYEI
jgi:hypothetical protein